MQWSTKKEDTHGDLQFQYMPWVSCLFWNHFTIMKTSACNLMFLHFWITLSYIMVMDTRHSVREIKRNMKNKCIWKTPPWKTWNMKINALPFQHHHPQLAFPTGFPCAIWSHTQGQAMTWCGEIKNSQHIKEENVGLLIRTTKCIQTPRIIVFKQRRVS